MKKRVKDGFLILTGAGCLAGAGYILSLDKLPLKSRCSVHGALRARSFHDASVGRILATASSASGRDSIDENRRFLDLLHYLLHNTIHRDCTLPRDREGHFFFPFFSHRPNLVHEQTDLRIFVQWSSAYVNDTFPYLTKLFRLR